VAENPSGWSHDRGRRHAYLVNYQIITSERATIASTVTYLLPAVAIVLGGIALVLAG
jgi:hypothetical protein